MALVSTVLGFLVKKLGLLIVIVLTGFLAWLEATPPGRTGYRQAS